MTNLPLSPTTIPVVLYTLNANGTVSPFSFGTSTNPIVITNNEGSGPGGGLTNAELRATAVAISATSLPLPSGSSTEATLELIKAKTDNLDVLLSTRTKPSDTQPVSLAIAPSTPVTGTFWQTTQPVSLATAPSTPVTGTFWQATQPVSLATAPSTPVTGTFWQATQPVSAASLPLPTGAATEATLATRTKPADQQHVLIDTSPILTNEQAAILAVTAVGSAGSAVTLTLPAVASQFHYITHIEIEAYATAARTGGATPTTVTSTNLPGNPAWTFETAQAVGTQVTKLAEPSMPLRSSVVNTATTIVCPATTSVIWRVNVWYRTAT